MGNEIALPSTANSRMHAVEMVATGYLRPYERNARTHSPEQVSQIIASIREFGWTNPVLCDERGRVIAGHGRLMAARELGLAEVPAIRLHGLTDTQKRALTLADNKLAMNSGWDQDLLKFELGSLLGDGFDVSIAGFTSEEVTDLLAVMDDNATEEPPPSAGEPVSRPGDIWIMGSHRFEVEEPDEPMGFRKKLAGKSVFMSVPVGLDADVAVEAWQKFTKRSAVLESDGSSFAEVADARRPEAIVRRRRA